MYCFKCPSSEHDFKDCPQARCGNRCPTPTGHWGTACPHPCTLCKGTDHYLRTCPSYRGFNPASPSGSPVSCTPRATSTSPSPSTSKTCYNCYGTGHFSGQCTERCRICSDEGHSSYVCPTRTGKPLPVPPQKKEENVEGEIPKYADKGTQTSRTCISSRVYRRMRLKRLFSESDGDEEPCGQSEELPDPTWEEHGQAIPSGSQSLTIDVSE